MGLGQSNCFTLKGFHRPHYAPGRRKKAARSVCAPLLGGAQLPCDHLLDTGLQIRHIQDSLLSGGECSSSRKRHFSVRNIRLTAAPWRCTVLRGNLEFGLIARYGSSAHGGNKSREASEGLTCCYNSPEDPAVSAGSASGIDTSLDEMVRSPKNAVFNAECEITGTVRMFGGTRLPKREKNRY